MIQDICQQLQQFLPNLPNCDHPLDLMRHIQDSNNWNCTLRSENWFASPRATTGATVYCDEYATVQEYAVFTGPVILLKGAFIGHFALVRGPAIIGPGAVVGPHTEVIRSIVMDETKLAHKNVVADSIFGRNVNFSGYSYTCNISGAQDSVKVRYRNEQRIYNGKFGATIDDNCFFGAGTAVMPGAYISPNTKVIGQCVVYGNNKVKSMVAGCNAQISQ